MQTSDITPNPTFSAHETVLHNSDWIPIIEKFDGVEMVVVPPGCFTMGVTESEIDEAFAMCEADGCKRWWFEDAYPSHEICFEKSFWIDRYEVNNSQISNFDSILLAGESFWAESERPREKISWLDANAFCAARKTRLPSEAEWEYAARGPDNLIFPWGNDFIADQVVYSKNSNNETFPVGSKTDSASWVGAYDLSGNVWEWVNTIYDPLNFPYPYDAEDGRETIDPSNILDMQRVLRGGSWQSDVSMLTTWYRTANNVIDSSSDWGFRCTRDE
jgi:formylglycine-generating enzyme required for sulfatase activity